MWYLAERRPARPSPSHPCSHCPCMACSAFTSQRVLRGIRCSTAWVPAPRSATHGRASFWTAWPGAANRERHGVLLAPLLAAIGLMRPCSTAACSRALKLSLTFSNAQLIAKIKSGKISLLRLQFFTPMTRTTNSMECGLPSRARQFRSGYTTPPYLIATRSSFTR